MTSIYLAHVDNNAHEVICTRPRQLVLLLCVCGPGTVGVWQHAQLQRKSNLGINLGSGFIP